MDDKKKHAILEELDVDVLMQNNIPEINFITWALLRGYIIADENDKPKFTFTRIILYGSMLPDPEGEERDWTIINMFKKHNVPYFFMPPRNFDISKIRLDEDSEDE